MFQTIQLVQHNQFHDAAIVPKREAFLEHPTTIATWARKRIGQCIKPICIYTSRYVYYSTMVYLLQQGDNPFHHEFVNLSKTVASNQVEFVDCNKSSPDGLVWSCGLRHHAARQCQTEDFPGSNLHGLSLNLLFEEFTSGSFTGPFNTYTVARLLSPNAFSRTPYRKTALVLSDSQCRQLKSIDGGTVVAVGGARYHGLADAIRKRRIQLRDYHTVIVVCGVNIAPFSESVWRTSWEALRRELMVIRDLPDTVLVFNSPVFTHEKRGVRQHTDWIKAEFHRAFSGPESKFSFCDWASSSADNFFVDDQYNQDHRFYHPDMLHVNHTGLRKMWNHWCAVADGMTELPYQLSDRFYQQVE